MKKGDLVRCRTMRPLPALTGPRRYRQRIGLITKVFLTESGDEEYRVAWLNAGGRSRCTRGVLELASEER